jgi:hypothetical protein
MNSSVLALSLALIVSTVSLGAASAGAKAAAPATASTIDGKVVESMNAAGYTYFLVETGSRKVWVAATQFAVKAGDRVVVADGMPMTNYHSKTLNRTFDVVYFTGSVAVNGKPAASHTATPAAPAAKSLPAADLANIARATGGQTVAEIYAAGAKLAGKQVVLRGRVVKYNGGILGKNWLHVRDGSGAEGSNDLTITSLDKARVGDLVLVTGVLATNRDFGGGYKYPLIIEDAALLVE